MLLAARKAAAFAAGLDYPQFCKQDLHQFAVLKALEIIGEARECHKPWGSSISVRAGEIRVTDLGTEGVWY